MFNVNNYSSEITPQIMSFDTLQKARQDLIGEITAVIDYDAHIRSTNDKSKYNFPNFRHHLTNSMKKGTLFMRSFSFLSFIC